MCVVFLDYNEDLQLYVLSEYLLVRCIFIRFMNYPVVVKQLNCLLWINTHRICVTSILKVSTTIQLLADTTGAHVACTVRVNRTLLSNYTRNTETATTINIRLIANFKLVVKDQIKLFKKNTFKEEKKKKRHENSLVPIHFTITANGRD